MIPIVAAVLMLGIWFTYVLPPAVAFAGCTKSQIKALKSQGFSQSKIDDICEDDDDDAPKTTKKKKIESKPSDWDDERPRPGMQQQGSNRCFTQVGACVLNQFGPPGYPCYCNSFRGPIPGMLQ